MIARFATTANDTLSGLAARDGVTPVAGDVALVNFQTTASQNGLYVAAAGAWTRATNFATAAQMIAGKLVAVTEGTIYADSLWEFATTGAITVGVTSLSFALIGPTFGADTRVSLPNSAAAQVTALQLLAALFDNTAGAELSTWEILLLNAGVSTSALKVFPNGLIVPTNILFRGDVDTGIVYAGADNFGIYCGGSNVLAFTAAGITLNAGIGANLLWGAGAGSVSYQSGNGRTTVQPAAAQGNVQLGLFGGALATNATHGFAAIQTCAGTPTGAPTSDTGFAPLVVDTTNNKLYAFYGAAWHDLTGA
jgi:hypothetical protein